MNITRRQLIRIAAKIKNDIALDVTEQMMYSLYTYIVIAMVNDMDFAKTN